MTNDNNIQFYYHMLLASMYPDKAAKQRMWAYIKQLTPAAAPL